MQIWTILFSTIESEGKFETSGEKKCELQNTLDWNYQWQNAAVKYWEIFKQS